MKTSLFIRAFFVSLVAALSLFLAFLSGYTLHDRLAPGQKSFSLLSEAYSLLISHGIKPPPADPALEYGMIRGMLQAYDDPYTTFLEPAQNELETNRLEGSFGGIGASFEKDGQGFVVIFPIADGPAARSGILERDRLLAVDDQPIGPDASIDQILAAIRGPTGQKVNLTVGRPPDYSPLRIAVPRETIPLPSVSWHVYPSEPRLGVIELNLISSSTAEEILNAAHDLQQRGATHLLLDLRDNGGGLLSGGVDVARLFLKEGLVVEQQDRDQQAQVFKVNGAGPLADIPMAILINQGTASATEIIAGSLQVQDRAKLVGTETYGKDSIQHVYSLKDGSSLHITVSHWSIPGASLPVEGHGLQPDVTLSAEEADSAAAIQAVIGLFFH